MCTWRSEDGLPRNLARAIAYPTPRAELSHTIIETGNLSLDPGAWDRLASIPETVDGIDHLRATIQVGDHPRYFIRLSIDGL